MTDTTTTEGRPSQQREQSRARGTRWWRRGFVPLLHRLHFLVGIFVGPFLLVAAVTGLLYALSPQIERWVYADQLTASQVTDQPVPLEDQVRAAAQVIPDGVLEEVRPAPTPGDTTRVSFLGPDLSDRAQTVFVDPATGDSRGVLTTYGEALPLSTWLDDLHRHLQLGAVGRVYSELAASWLWVLTLSGLAMWLTRRRRRRRDAVLPQRDGSPRARRVGRHAVIGTWAAVGFLFLSATGLTWSQFAGQNVSTLRAELSWTSPSVQTGLDSPDPDSGGSTGSGDATAADPARAADVALSAAEAAGLRAPLSIRPGGSSSAWTVTEAKRSWPVQADSVAVDAATGTVVDRVDFADWPLMAKLSTWGIDAHMGVLFGVANQIALVALAVALIAIVVLGYRLWWTRGPRRRLSGPAAGATDVRAARGAFLVLVAVGSVAAVVLPVLGASLLLFLLVDSVSGAGRAALSGAGGPSPGAAGR